MKERPILFSAPMVRALLDGSKTQTRRALRDQPPEDVCRIEVDTFAPIVFDRHDDAQPGPEHFGAFDATGSWGTRSPYGQPGDRLWVREAHSLRPAAGDPETIVAAYRATDDECNAPWRPSIHMPRWASRITLEVTDVRVERLQDISEADAVAEGCKADPFPGPWWQGYRDDGNGDLMHTERIGEQPPDWMIEPRRMKAMTHLDRSARDGYRTLWMNINGADSWAANPWVWVIEFKAAGQRSQFQSAADA